MSGKRCSAISRSSNIFRAGLSSWSVSASPRDQQRVFIQKHGVDTVNQALQVYVYEKSAEARRANEKVQALHADTTGRVRQQHGLAIAEAILPIVPIASWKVAASATIGIKGPQELNTARIDANLQKMEKVNLQAARAAAEVRRINGLPSVDELARPTVPLEVNRPNSGASMHTYSIPLSPPSTRPGGVSTKEIARAYLNKGNWPVMTTFTLGYRPMGEAGAP